MQVQVFFVQMMQPEMQHHFMWQQEILYSLGRLLGKNLEPFS